MSHLSRPRIHFLGKFKVNPATANNLNGFPNNPKRLYDALGVKLNMEVPDDIQDWIQATIRPLLEDPVTAVQANPALGNLAYGFIKGAELPSGDPSAQQQAINDAAGKCASANWSYYGDDGVAFEQTKITGIELASGEFITDSAQDSLIGASVELLGSKFFDRRSHAVMVDLDPNGGDTSQLFSGLLRLVKNNETLLAGERPKRAHALWVKFDRNVGITRDTGASAVWQIGVHHDDLTFLDSAAHTSPALVALQDVANAGQGLLFRFCTYLINRVRRTQANVAHPRHLLLVGTIGSWEEGEIASIPVGRMLFPNTPLLNRPNTPPTDQPAPIFAGPALAKVDHQRKVIVLDLVNTFPEENYVDLDPNDPPANAPEKHDLGVLSLYLRSATANIQEIVPIAALPFDRYNKAAYLERSGIVEVPYPDALEDQLDSGQLLIAEGTTFTLGAKIFLKEKRVNILPSEHNIVLDVGQSATVKLKVLDRGEIPTSPTQVTLSQIVDKSNVAVATNLDQRNSELADVASSLVTLSATQVPTDQNGVATFVLEAHTPGICHLEFVADIGLDESFPAPVLRAQRYYMTIRVLPDDTFPEAQFSDDFLRDRNNYPIIYRTLFAYYDVLFPAMSKIINFSNRADVLRGTNPTLIKTFTEPGAFDSTLYMPVSRDMSRGKRELLRRWCSLLESIPN